MNRQMYLVLVLTLVSLGGGAGPSWAIDPVLQEAQSKLSTLGYDVGVADGIYGPRTRQALEAFQRAQHLPVTGILDAETLQTLDRATTPPGEAKPRAMPIQDGPLRVVLRYLRFYTFQPARVLPYVTEAFRGGVSPQEWIEQTIQTLADDDYIYLQWKIRRVEVADTQATVEVHTRVRTQGQERRRREVFILQRTADGAWLIDQWRVEALPPVAATTSEAGS